MKNPPRIVGIGTAVPAYFHMQKDIEEKFCAGARSSKARKYIRTLYQNSGIESRYSVLPDIYPEEGPCLFPLQEDGTRISLATAERNDWYRNEAPPLTIEAAKQALDTSGVRADEITHIITATCTGLYNPGPDFELCDALGIPATVERYQINFMGCYAAFPSLRMAHTICRAQPASKVLLVCTEISTLHLQLKEDPNTLLANSVFADGAAAAVVCSEERGAQKAPSLIVHDFASMRTDSGAKDMAWSVGNTGFDITLTRYVAKILGENIQDIAASLLQRMKSSPREITRWAIHPGGKLILDKISEKLQIEDDLLPSREILRQYGNMSSATILFVLKNTLENHSITGHACAMAFGPGLAVESMLFSKG